MTAKRKSMKTKLSEGEINEIVEAQADNDSAWETPIRVQRRKPSSLRLPAKLAARAAFLARLHREAVVEDWLTRIILERIELEEVAFAAAKRDMSVKGSA